MAGTDVVIKYGGRRVSADDVADRLAIRKEDLLDAIRAVGVAEPSGIDLFYREWSCGMLPVAVRPCTSMSLYRLYEWWARSRKGYIQTETMLLKSLPDNLEKSRRWVRLGIHKRTRMVVQPAGWIHEQGRPLADQLGEQEAAFLRELEAVT